MEKVVVYRSQLEASVDQALIDNAGLIFAVIVVLLITVAVWGFVDSKKYVLHRVLIKYVKRDTAMWIIKLTGYLLGMIAFVGSYAFILKPIM